MQRAANAINLTFPSFRTGAVFLILLNLLAYWPALYHIPRADHVIYMAELSDVQDSFTELTFKAYDLNRRRVLGPGDQYLFRPLLYIVLGLEYYFFGFNFAGWQAMSLVLHILALLVLWRICRRWQPHVVTLLWVALFSVMIGGSEMVMWTHVSPYLLSVLLLLVALDQADLYFRDRSARRLPFMAVALGLGCFLFEPFLLFSGAFAIFVAVLRAHKRIVWIFLLGPAVYLMWSALSYSGGVMMSLSPHPFWTLINIIGTQLQWISLGLTVFAYDVNAAERIVLTGKLGDWNYFALAGSVSLLLGTGYAMKWRSNAWCRLVMACILIFAVAVVLGRINERGLGYLNSNLYYTYFFWALLIPLVVAWLNPDRLPHLGITWRGRCFAAGLVLLIIFNASQVWQTGYTAMLRDRELRDTVGAIRAWTKHHPDTRITFSSELPGTQPEKWLRKKVPEGNQSYLRLLFHRHYDEDAIIQASRDEASGGMAFTSRP